MSTTDLHIRPGRTDEIEAIYAVHRDSVTALCGEHYTPAQIAMWLEGRTPVMYLDAIGRGELWVAVDGDGRVAGFVEKDDREVSKLFVRGGRAGRGVGAALLATAIAAIREAGHRSAYLEATRNACAFYGRHGFVASGEGVFSRGGGGVSIEVVKMERELG